MRRLDAFRGLEQRHPAIYLPARPAGHQRDVVLRAADPQHRRDDADRLHADGRARLPAIQPYFPQTARPVPQLSAQGPHPPIFWPIRASTASRPSSSATASAFSALAIRAPAAWASRSASFRSTRLAPGCIRRRRCRSFSTSAPTTANISTIRFISAGSTSACAAPTTMSSSRRSSMRCASAGRMCCCIGRISPSATPTGC